MATTARERIAESGWRRPCRERGSGTSARTSSRERLVRNRRSSLPEKTPAPFTFTPPSRQDQSSNSPGVWAAEKLVEFLYTSTDEAVLTKNSPRAPEELSCRKPFLPP